MKIKIRYEEKVQAIDLDEAASDEFCVTIGIEGENLSSEDKRKAIQEWCDENLNKSDYNNYHKFYRHWGNTKAQPDENSDEVDSLEPLMSEVTDDRIFRKDEFERERCENEEAVCQWIRKVFQKKPNVAEAFIATKIDGISIREYVSLTAKSGDDIAKLENNLSKKLTRAAKKLAEAYPDGGF